MKKEGAKQNNRELKETEITINTEKLAQPDRRKVLLNIALGGSIAVGLTAMPEKWVKPVIDKVLVPAHAQTSECFAPPTLPDPMQNLTISDNSGNPIDAIDISGTGLCGGYQPPCTGYTATGLPTGLSMSLSGIITGSYNATGTEAFRVLVNAVVCGENIRIGEFTLTIKDEG